MLPVPVMLLVLSKFRPVELLAAMVRLLPLRAIFPVKIPLPEIILPRVSTPEAGVTKLMLFAIVVAPLVVRVAEPPAASPRLMVPVPGALALERMRVPFLMSRMPAEMALLTPFKFKAEVVLFSMMLVTLVPMTALMSDSPEPVPELVIVPVLLTPPVEIVRLSAVELLLSRIMLPVPLTALETVNFAEPLLSVRVVPPLFTVRAVAPETVSVPPALSVMPVTLAPMPPLIVTASPPALPVPLLVMVPVLLTRLLEIVTPPPPSLVVVTLPVPVMPPVRVGRPAAVDRTVRLLPLRAIAPLKVGVMVPAPMSLMVSVPEVWPPKLMALAIVPATLPTRVALVLPEGAPKVMAPALAPVAVLSWSVPLWMVVPPE